MILRAPDRFYSCLWRNEHRRNQREASDLNSLTRASPGDLPALCGTGLGRAAQVRARPPGSREQAGRQPIELTPTRLLRLSKDLPHDWSEQRHVLGFAA